MNPVIGYIRVSTEEQADSRLSLEAQEQSIRAWVEAQGHFLIGIHADEAVKGSKGLAADKMTLDIGQRPGLQRAIEALTTNALLVIVRRDRLGRDVVVSALLERLVDRKGAKIVSIAGEGSGDEPADALMRRIIDAFAEYERLLISSRTKAALAAKKFRGEVAGKPPFGYRAEDGKLVVDRNEQAIIAVVMGLRDAGLQFRKIVEALKADDRIVNREGKPFVLSAVHAIYKEGCRARNDDQEPHRVVEEVQP